MPLLATVNMVAECLRTDCNILGDKIKKVQWIPVSVQRCRV